MEPFGPVGLPEIEGEESEVFSGDSDPEATTDCLKTILTEKFAHLLTSSSCSSGTSPKARTPNNSETSQVEPTSKMEETEYKRRLRGVKIAKLKVKDAKRLFLAENLSEMYVSQYTARLKEIRDKLDLYNEAVAELLVDLDDDSPEDKRRINELQENQTSIRAEVLENEKEVKQKMKELLPISYMGKNLLTF